VAPDDSSRVPALFACSADANGLNAGP
jgi:hypothetical protein